MFSFFIEIHCTFLPVLFTLTQMGINLQLEKTGTLTKMGIEAGQSVKI